MVNPAALANEGRLPRPVETRLRNDHIAAAARLNRFDRQIAVPFICECSDHRCEELIPLTLGEFHAARTESDYLVAPGHQVESARIVRVRDGLWLYQAEPVSRARRLGWARNAEHTCHYRHEPSMPRPKDVS